MSDLIERAAVLDLMRTNWADNDGDTAMQLSIDDVRNMPAAAAEDAVSRQAVLDGLTSIAKAKAKSDAQKSLMGRVIFFTEQLPPVTPKPLDSVLDEIKAEITRRHLSINEKSEFDNGRTYAYEEVIDVIDKYKAESEGKE